MFDFDEWDFHGYLDVSIEPLVKCCRLILNCFDMQVVVKLEMLGGALVSC